MSALLILVYGVVSYLIGMVGLFYFMAYMGGWEFLPLHIDSGVPGPFGQAVAINIAIILLWGIQHTVMARPTFKRAWTKIIPKAAERSTYVLLSGVLMLVICYYWQAIEGTVWQVSNSVLASVLIGLHLAGWAIAVITSFIINHFDLFGLQQVYLNFVGKPAAEPKFTERLFYKIVRHPLQFGLLLGLWAAPVMSATHFMLSLCMTIYIFIGLHYEEKTLAAELGQSYEDYRKRVWMIVPIPKG